MRLIDPIELKRAISVAAMSNNHKTLEQIIDEQPTIERKKGKWIVYYHGEADFSYSCNQCGYSAPYGQYGGEYSQKKWRFCPNCGARMEI